jgi:hypothetical protein
MSDSWEFLPTSRTWITITDAEIAAGARAAPVLLALNNNAEFIREGVLGRTNTTVVSVPHVHDNVDSPGLEHGSFGRNLITNSAPDHKAMGDWWPKPKYSTKKAPHVYPAAGLGFYFDGRKNAHVWTIPTTRADVAKMVWGGGAICTFSAFVRRTGTATQGEWSFGAATSNGWIPGARFAVDYTDLTTSFQRFYGTAVIAPELTEGSSYLSNVSGIGGSVELDQLNGPRFELRVTDDFDCGLQATAFMWTLGERLHWYMPSRMDKHGNGDEHDDWNNYGLTTCPAWETSVAFTNAVRLYGV